MSCLGEPLYEQGKTLGEKVKNILSWIGVILGWSFGIGIIAGYVIYLSYIAWELLVSVVVAVLLIVFIVWSFLYRSES